MDAPLDGGYVVTWTDTCCTVDGDWTAHIGVEHITDVAVEATAVQTCNDNCTTSGSLLVDLVETLSFDGSAAPTFSDLDGHSGALALTCAP